MDSDKIMKIVGEKIKRRRAELGMTQQKLADIMGKTRQDISRYENNKVPNPTIVNLCEVAEALGLELWELLRPAGQSDDELEISNGLKEFQNYLNSKGISLREEELNFLRSIKIGGSAPNKVEIYLAIWLILKGLSSRELDKLVKSIGQQAPYLE